MSAADFNFLRAYHSIFPFGDVRGDLQSGVVASTIANVNRRQGSKPYTPADFIPRFNRPEKTSDEVIMSRISNFMRKYK